MYSQIRSTCNGASIWICFFILGVFASHCTVAAGQDHDAITPITHTEADGLGLTLTAAKSRFVPCEPIIAEVILSNASSSVRSLTSFGMANDYDITVTDKDGKEVSRTQYGDGTKIKMFGGGKRKVLTLEPGRGVAGHITVNRIYDMTMAGAYKIAIKHVGFLRQTGEGRVVLAPPPIEVEVSEVSPFRETQSPGVAGSR